MLSKVLAKERKFEEGLHQARKAQNSASSYIGPRDEETLMLALVIADVQRSCAKHYPGKKNSMLMQAKHLLEQTIISLGQVKGPNSPATVLGKEHLTNVLDDLEELTMSQQLSEEIIASKRCTLGEQHLGTFQATMNLALCLIKQAKLDQAEQLVTQALNSATPIVNSHHLGRAKGLQILASIHDKKAELWRQRAADALLVELKTDEQVNVRTSPGSKMPTATSYYDALQAESCKSDGESSVKASHYSSAVHEGNIPSPIECPHTPLGRPSRPVQEELVDYEKAALREYQLALEYKYEIVDQLLAAPGIEHPHTLQHLIDTSKTLLHHYLTNREVFATQGEQAETWQRDVLAVQLDLLGEQHEDVLHTKGLLAVTLHELGKAADAEPFAFAAFRARTAKLGKSHRETLDMQQLLAEIMNKQSSSAKRAVDLIHSCWSLSHNAFGPTESSTKERLSLWREWKTASALAEGMSTSSNTHATASASASRILHDEEGMSRMLTHNTLRFTLVQSTRFGALGTVKEEDISSSPLYRSTKVTRGFSSGGASSFATRPVAGFRSLR